MYTAKQAKDISINFLEAIDEEKAKSIKVAINDLKFNYNEIDDYLYRACAYVSSGTGILTAMDKYQNDFVSISFRYDADRCVDLNADIKRLKNLLSFWYPDASDIEEIKESEKLVK